VKLPSAGYTQNPELVDMRLWSLHPKYLDPQGLVALWRESLLARAVLEGATRGYRHHPQLERFRAQQAPIEAINAYLRGVHAEACRRGFAFDEGKLRSVGEPQSMLVTTGQLEREWLHLLEKLSSRSPALFERWRSISAPDCHPMFQTRPGDVEHGSARDLGGCSTGTKTRPGHQDTNHEAERRSSMLFCLPLSLGLLTLLACPSSHRSSIGDDPVAVQAAAAWPPITSPEADPTPVTRVGKLTFTPIEARKSVESYLGRDLTLECDDGTLHLTSSEAVPFDTLVALAGRRVEIVAVRIPAHAPNPAEQAPMVFGHQPMLRPETWRVLSVTVASEDESPR
jgi:hypothetical protein